MEALTVNNFDRLAKAMMQRHNASYARARGMLAELRLHLVCGETIRDSAALQAAFLTAVNTGKRAFRGGVTVQMPADVALQVPWPGATTLNDVARALGAQEKPEADAALTARLNFGNPVKAGHGMHVACDGWRAVLLPFGNEETLAPSVDFALGGIFAGGFAVAQAFLNASGITHREVDEPVGISLWRPDLCWRDPAAAGPALEQLPAKLWLLGLGHLGQAYAWTISLLPFASTHDVTIYLQDFDVVEEGNWSAGLFCESNHVRRLKTRLAAEWLEARGFQTRLVERPFDAYMKRGDDEPRVALCGFDNAESRQALEDAGFELVVDAGLGASLDHFDRIVLRTFPEAAQKARAIWTPTSSAITPMNPALFNEDEEECGIIFEEIGGKAISSSFTGACASAVVAAEVLRAIHGGRRCEFMALQLRDLQLPQQPYRDENYQLRVVRNGLVTAAM